MISTAMRATLSEGAREARGRPLGARGRARRQQLFIGQRGECLKPQAVENVVKWSGMSLIPWAGLSLTSDDTGAGDRPDLLG